MGPYQRFWGAGEKDRLFSRSRGAKIGILRELGSWGTASRLFCANLWDLGDNNRSVTVTAEGKCKGFWGNQSIIFWEQGAICRAGSESREVMTAMA